MSEADSDSPAIALVDGYNMAFRAYYGMPELTRGDGFPTGAIHGWVRSMWWIEDNFEPEKVVVFFDLGGASRQTALHADYKANRSETPPELEQQVPVIKEWTRAMGYGGLEIEGVEADDLIGACAVQLANSGKPVEIVSADKDLAQLVRPGIVQQVPPPTANPKLGWRRLDEAGVKKKFGIPPSQVADYLAIIGDTSDNIPGLKGVGPKTALKWLLQYKSIDEIIAHSGELQPKRFQSLVHSEQEKLRVYREMTTLDLDHDVDLDAIPAPDFDRAREILTAMEMGKAAVMLDQRIGR